VRRRGEIRQRVVPGVFENFHALGDVAEVQRVVELAHDVAAHLGYF
jgi:hypothetical protein